MKSATSLAHRLALQLTAAVLVVCAGVLVAWIGLGRQALQHEHEQSSLRMAALFEAGLHHAMLQRDLPGLEHLLTRLGGLPGLQAAALVEPGGEVRFASAPARLHTREDAALRGLCLTARCGAVSPPRLEWRPALDDAGPSPALRVIYPVRNQDACGQCHGPVEAHPVNGVLLLDFQPMATEQDARAQAGVWLLPISLAALVLLGLLTGRVLRREVLVPVSALAARVQRYAGGDLQVRSGAVGRDELARLARGFDHLADQVREQMAAVAAQGEFLQALLDASPDPLLVVALDHRIVLANAAYLRLLGRERPAVVGQPCHRISRGCDTPCLTTLVQCPLVECRAGSGTLSLRTVMAFRHADGHPIDVEVHAASLTARDGTPLVVQVIRPLEDQVRASQELRLSAIGLLANGVAHEIHNPLASIRLALQSALRTLQGGTVDREELTDYLRLVDEQIDRCVAITQRLLRLSEPASEQVQPVHVRHAVDDVLALLGEEMHRAGVHCEVDWGAPDPRVLMDDSGLRQVLINLVHNAIRAMPQGGRLAVSTERCAGGCWRIRVQDSGVGIPPDRLALIFLPFYSRLADGRRGSGLGLAISKGLVEQRGGRILVDSQVGHGSRFDVELPDADADAEAGADPDAQGAGR